MRTRRASQAIEFALVMPVLIAMIAGVLDYGWYFTQDLATAHAAEAGARAGSLAAPGDPMERAAATAGAILADWGIADPTIHVSQHTDSRGSRLIVEVVAPFDPLLELVPLPTTLGSVSTGWMETQPLPPLM